jgi:hypothetical protein
MMESGVFDSYGPVGRYLLHLIFLRRRESAEVDDGEVLE